MDGEAPEPIEVELVARESSSGGRDRFRRDRDRTEPAEASGEADPGHDGVPAVVDRSRLVVVVAVTAVLALALGWMFGRATSDDGDTFADDAPDTTRATTTTVGPRMTLPIVGDAIDEPEFDEPVVPSRPGDGSGTTTGPSGPTTQSIAVDERLVDVPIRLVGVELGGVLVEVDLTTGILTDFGADRLVSDGRPLVVGPDWVVAPGPASSRVIWSDGTETTLDLGDRWQHLHVPGTNWFWQFSAGSPVSSSVSPPTDDVTSATLVGLDGQPVGPTLELPLVTWPHSVDPATGGLVVTAGMRNYVVGPDGVEYLGAGQPITLTNRTVVTYDCDESLDCGLRRIDRGTGDVAVVPPDPELEGELQWNGIHGWGGASTTAVSPDDRWVAVIGSSWRTSAAGLVDLDSGEFVELARDSYPFEVVWSPDGRWAIALADREVIAYDTVTGDRFPVFTDPVQWIQLGARPSADTEAGAEGGGTLLSADAPSAAAEEAVEG